MGVVIDRTWETWEDTTSGGGSVSTNASYTLETSGGIGDQAYKRLTKVVKAGQTFRFRVEARLLSTSGDTDTDAGIFIDYPSETSLVAEQRIDSFEWKSYELVYTVKEDHTPASESMSIVCGIVTDSGGSAEFREPRMEAIEGVDNVSVWASGTVTIDVAGNVVLEERSPTNGVFAYSYAAPDLKITVAGIDAKTGIDPVPVAYMTTAAPDSYLCKAPSKVTGGTNGQFNIKIFDVSTGAYLVGNPSADTTVYFEVKY